MPVAPRLEGGVKLLMFLLHAGGCVDQWFDGAFGFHGDDKINVGWALLPVFS